MSLTMGYKNNLQEKHKIREIEPGSMQRLRDVCSSATKRSVPKELAEKKEVRNCLANYH
jgi:hypothetical protein